MKNTVITMNSETYAMKAKRTLSAYAIPSEVIKLDPESAKRGCAFGIELKNGYTADSAVRILTDAGIPYSKVRKS